MWTKELILSLVMMASEISGYPPPETVKFQVISQAKIAAIACPSAPKPSDCRVVGFVPNNHPDTMYITKLADPNDIWDRAIVIHEAVHIMQHEAGVLDADNPSCFASLKAEMEAYGVSNKYLMDNNLRPVRPPMRCYGGK